MGVSPAILKKHGCHPDLWKPLFVAGPDKKDKRIKGLELLVQNRLDDGKLWNLSNYRTYAAIDMAYNVPFNQTTPTIIQHLLAKKWGKEDNRQQELLAELERWGLNVDELFLDMGTNADGIRRWALNPPTFYKILVPLVKAYVTIRWAKLFNDRNVNPFLKYDPLYPNDENRVMCEILTHMMQVMTSEYGYQNTLKDTIFQTLMYATCLAFPREVWHSEYQLENVDGKEKSTLQREGIRYEMPHPTRMFYDLHYPISTFNTDSGCEWAGYWKIVKYGQILDNPNYWNRKSIGYSGRNWTDPALTSNFFQEIYPCRLEWPVPANPNPESRERAAAFYASNQRDMAVFESNLFMKLVPKRFGLGDYKYPIWVRFIVASDNTILYAEPCCYNPIRYCGYDSTALQSNNSSMALEVLPFQDIVGNTLSQIILTAKQNLANINFYDKNVLSPEDIDKIKNGGETALRSINFIAFDGMKNLRAGLDSKDAIHSITFTRQDLQPMFQTLNTVLGILERLLQLSAQESGSAASHQQSKAEIELVGSSTSNRVQFTGSFIDDSIDAWKRQLYDAAVAYMDDPIEAFVSADIPNLEVHLKTLGFTVVGTPGTDGRVKVTGSKKSLNIDALATTNRGPDTKDNAQVAQIMMQAIQGIASNQVLVDTLGPKPILDLMQKAAILAGVDKDFVLRPDVKQQVSQLQQMAQQIQLAAAKQVEENVTKPTAEHLAKMDAEIQQLDQAMAKVIQTLGLNQPQPPPQQPQSTDNVGRIPVL